MSRARHLRILKRSQRESIAVILDLRAFEVGCPNAELILKAILDTDGRIQMLYSRGRPRAEWAEYSSPGVSRIQNGFSSKVIMRRARC